MEGPVCRRYRSLTSTCVLLKHLLYGFNPKLSSTLDKTGQYVHFGVDSFFILGAEVVGVFC